MNKVKTLKDAAKLMATLANDQSKIELYSAALQTYAELAKMPANTLQERTKAAQDAWANFPELFNPIY